MPKYEIELGGSKYEVEFANEPTEKDLLDAANQIEQSLKPAGNQMYNQPIGPQPPAYKPAAAQVGSRIAQAVGKVQSPYKWGGTDPVKGADCSGATCIVAEQFGVKLPRTAIQQFKDNRASLVKNPKELQPGDLVFFETKKGDKARFDKDSGRYVTHVGVYVGNGRFRHQSTDKAKGMTEAKLEGRWAQQFVGARRHAQMSAMGNPILQAAQGKAPQDQVTQPRPQLLDILKNQNRQNAEIEQQRKAEQARLLSEAQRNVALREAEFQRGIQNVGMVPPALYGDRAAEGRVGLEGVKLPNEGRTGLESTSSGISGALRGVWNIVEGASNLAGGSIGQTFKELPARERRAIERDLGLAVIDSVFNVAVGGTVSNAGKVLAKGAARSGLLWDVAVPAAFIRGYGLTDADAVIDGLAPGIFKLVGRAVEPLVNLFKAEPLRGDNFLREMEGLSWTRAEDRSAIENVFRKYGVEDVILDLRKVQDTKQWGNISDTLARNALEASKRNAWDESGRAIGGYAAALPGYSFRTGFESIDPSVTFRRPADPPAVRSTPARFNPTPDPNYPAGEALDLVGMGRPKTPAQAIAGSAKPPQPPASVEGFGKQNLDTNVPNIAPKDVQVGSDIAERTKAALAANRAGDYTKSVPYREAANSLSVVLHGDTYANPDMRVVIDFTRAMRDVPADSGGNLRQLVQEVLRSRPGREQSVGSLFEHLVIAVEKGKISAQDAHDWLKASTKGDFGGIDLDAAAEDILRTYGGKVESNPTNSAGPRARSNTKNQNVPESRRGPSVKDSGNAGGPPLRGGNELLGGDEGARAGNRVANKIGWAGVVVPQNGSGERIARVARISKAESAWVDAVNAAKAPKITRISSKRGNRPEQWVVTDGGTEAARINTSQLSDGTRKQLAVGDILYSDDFSVQRNVALKQNLDTNVPNIAPKDVQVGQKQVTKPSQPAQEIKYSEIAKAAGDDLDAKLKALREARKAKIEEAARGGMSEKASGYTPDDLEYFYEVAKVYIQKGVQNIQALAKQMKADGDDLPKPVAKRLVDEGLVPPPPKKQPAKTKPEPKGMAVANAAVQDLLDMVGEEATRGDLFKMQEWADEAVAKGYNTIEYQLGKAKEAGTLSASENAGAAMVFDRLKAMIAAGQTTYNGQSIAKIISEIANKTFKAGTQTAQELASRRGMYSGDSFIGLLKKYYVETNGRTMSPAAADEIMDHVRGLESTIKKYEQVIEDLEVLTGVIELTKGTRIRLKNVQPRQRFNDAIENIKKRRTLTPGMRSSMFGLDIPVDLYNRIKADIPDIKAAAKALAEERQKAMNGAALTQDDALSIAQEISDALGGEFSVKEINAVLTNRVVTPRVAKAASAYKQVVEELARGFREAQDQVNKEYEAQLNALKEEARQKIRADKAKAKEIEAASRAEAKKIKEAKAQAEAEIKKAEKEYERQLKAQAQVEAKAKRKADREEAARIAKAFKNSPEGVAQRLGKTLEGINKKLEDTILIQKEWEERAEEFLKKIEEAKKAGKSRKEINAFREQYKDAKMMAEVAVSGYASRPSGSYAGKGNPEVERLRIEIAARRREANDAVKRLAAQAEMDALDAAGVSAKTKAVLTALSDLPRSAAASSDFSAGLNQVLPLAFISPLEWGKAVGKGVWATTDRLRGFLFKGKLGASELNNVREEIMASVYHDAMIATNLFDRRALNDVFGGDLNVPIIKDTQIGFEATVEYAKFKMFEYYADVLHMSRKNTLNPVTIDDYRAIAQIVKTMTGQADIGFGLAANTLSKFLFAARFFASLIQQATFGPGWKALAAEKGIPWKNKALTKAVSKHYLKAIGSLALGANAFNIAMEASVNQYRMAKDENGNTKRVPTKRIYIETNFLSTDYGKLVRIEEGKQDQAYDVFPAAARIARQLYTLLSGQKITRDGVMKNLDDQERAEELSNFLVLNRMNPLFQTFYNQLPSSSDVSGRRYGEVVSVFKAKDKEEAIWNTLKNMFAPLAWRQFGPILQDESLRNDEKALLVAAGLFANSSRREQNYYGVDLPKGYEDVEKELRATATTYNYTDPEQEATKVEYGGALRKFAEPIKEKYSLDEFYKATLDGMTDNPSAVWRERRMGLKKLIQTQEYRNAGMLKRGEMLEKMIRDIKSALNERYKTKE